VAGVAIMAGLAMALEMVHLTSEPVYVTVSAVIGSVFALGALRKPWFFLAVLVAVCATFPRVSDCSAWSMVGGTYGMSTILGALAGWTIRGCRTRTHVNIPAKEYYE
jgi:hypothetical protein